MSALALQRLGEERKNFRRDRPFGFSAKPSTREDGSVDLFNWKCIVPGKEGTYCEGGKFPVTIAFPNDDVQRSEANTDFPAIPPIVYLPKNFLHVNVFPSGAVCLSILKTDIPEHLAKVSGADAWKPSVSIKQILLSIQELLHNPFFGSVANSVAYNLKTNQGLAAYERKMREQTKQYAGDADDE